MQDVVKAYRKIVHLSFPPESSGKPIVCNLTKLFDLTFNILQASISSRQEGSLILELTGSEENYHKGVDYLKEHDISVQAIAQKISRDDDLCIDCGVCTALCPTHALYMDREKRTCLFDSEKCTACGKCTRVCPVNAMNIQISESDM
ncbi:NIL domain-containing protein [Desulfobaculum bizertense]|uniref:4Fe-4S dicluster domain-containing protein n=1 Tax=Desulfobaculum bizertense DSM 18034 TaxID=1121442 RepID=A0A1T4W2J8_9BACT|nr:NIL domain-containing protein [Desulfobaculum bizertense]UIJ38850.1 4Fe-4S binding protein [Desulfobaculum bizertense]SKA71417.1 4Fe-4S dicluster domain-containing protein [Desulfobaculum bizertense DSM 18034]